MPFFEYNGLNLHYVDECECPRDSCGVPVVFVHGAGSSHEIWTFQLDKFARTRRVVAPDLSGHGKSEPTTKAEITIEEYAHEIRALVDHLGLDQFVLTGHSMGGGVVMFYLLQNSWPQPVAAVLVDTSTDLDLTKLVPGLLIETVENYLFLLREQIADSQSLAFKIVKAEEERKRANPEMVQKDLRACDKFDITQKVHEIKIPVFVIHGEDDDIIPLGYAEQLISSLSRSDIAIVKKADHCPMVQQPETFNRLLSDFLDWVDRKYGSKQS